jgi:hypothetical protein
MTHKPGDKPEHTVKRTPAKPARGHAKQPPRFSLVTGSLDLVAPEDCSTSLLFKEVSHDTGGRHYRMWLAVGRNDQDALSIRYKHNGESTVRCDVPESVDFSPAALQPYLAKFLAAQHNQPGGPPSIDP